MASYIELTRSSRADIGWPRTVEGVAKPLAEGLEDGKPTRSSRTAASAIGWAATADLSCTETVANWVPAGTSSETTTSPAPSSGPPVLAGPASWSRWRRSRFSLKDESWARSAGRLSRQALLAGAPCSRNIPELAIMEK